VQAADPALASCALGAATATGVFVAWSSAVSLAAHVHPTRAVRDGALFAHLAALVIGAMIVVDWLGILWVLGRRSLVEVTRTAAAVHALIWAGLATLVISGTLLEPNASAAVTR